VTTQRSARKNMEKRASGVEVKNGARISPEQIALLDKLGFEWCPGSGTTAGGVERKWGRVAAQSVNLEASSTS
jgi:hypothetical protein